MSMTVLPHQFRLLRVAAGLSLRDVAEEIEGVPPSFFVKLGLWERGKTHVSPEIEDKIAEAYANLYAEQLQSMRDQAALLIAQGLSLLETVQDAPIPA